MICGIFGTVKDIASNWETIPQLDFSLSVSENTGEIAAKKQARTKGLTFIISENQTGEPSCSFRGSLHKEAHGINFNRFTFDELKTTLSKLNTVYLINLNTTLIHSLEIEINLYLKYSPQRILKAAITHKRKPFTSVSKYDSLLGKMAVYDDHIVKMYDKGRAEKLKGENILRFGVRVSKMRFLQRYDIKTLSDLQSVEKVAPLVGLLIDAARDIVFFDFNAPAIGLTEKQVLRWQQFSNPNYWEATNKSETYKAKAILKKMGKKLNATDYNTQLLNWVSFEWNYLLGGTKQGIFSPSKNDSAAQKKATFTHFIYTVQRSPGMVPGDLKTIPILECENTSIQRRFCDTCGREITNQKKNSRFCSELIFGKEAKACRNKASGKTRTLKQHAQRTGELQTMVDLINSGMNPNKQVVILRTTKCLRREMPTLEKLNGWKWTKVRRVIRLTMRFDNGFTVELTTKRAKAYIRYLQKRQNKKN